MEENLLFRMNFILQDSFATTLDANLVKIIEVILLERRASISCAEIKNEIEKSYHLEFSEEEIETAINRKGKNIVFDGENYGLKPSSIKSLSNRVAISEELYRYVKMAIYELELHISEKEMYELIEKYLYYCFNTNKDTLLALVNNNLVEKYDSISFANEEIKLINDFLQWDNPEKNKCIYKLISYCYIYCSLTVKKNNMLSTKLFRGKRFLLDANIVFRLAGINNDSRKRTIVSFAKKCEEVGIDLCYTEETIDEIYRVIANKVRWIKRLTGGGEPLDLSKFENSENDFYNLYITWLDNEKNAFDDYEGFKSYLLNLVSDVLVKLKITRAENYEVIDSNRYNNYLNSLEEYKSNHTIKKQAQASLKADVNNVMHIMRLRKNDSSDLWSTKEFLISADQNLIGWATEIARGIPLVVLPSVWLTILLRFTGRQTADDYKAFCCFLELRQHNEPDEINVYSLVERLVLKTDNTELKRKVIEEVFSHKNDYKIENDDSYDEVIEKAFDKIYGDREKENVKLIGELEKNLDKEKQKRQRALLAVDESVRDEKARSAYKMALQDQIKHFKLLEVINKYKTLSEFIIVVFIFIIFALTCRKEWWLYKVLVLLLGEQINLDTTLAILGLITVGLAAIRYFFNKAIKSLNSDKTKEDYRKKREKYYLDILNS